MIPYTAVHLLYFKLLFIHNTKKVNGNQLLVRNNALWLIIVAEPLKLPAHLFFIFVTDVEVQFY